MEDKIFFSIIVPAYQVEKYLEECMESIVHQLMNETEIIIIDDGSTDCTGEIADRYANEFEHVKIIHQENQGLSAARNTGLHSARGKYCVFVDSDDYLCTNALTNLKNCIIKYNEPELIVSRRKSIDSEGKIEECKYFFEEERLKNFSVAQVYSYLQSMPDSSLGVWIFSVRMDYIRDNSFYFAYGLFHEDEEWVPKVLLNTSKVAFNNHLLYCNRINRKSSITQTHNIKREFDKLKIIDLLEKEFNKSKYSLEIKAVMKERIRSIYFGIVSNVYKYKEDKYFSKILDEITQRRNLLKRSTRLHHQVCYILLKYFGVKMTSFLIAKYSDICGNK